MVVAAIVDKFDVLSPADRLGIDLELGHGHAELAGLALGVEAAAALVDALLEEKVL
jgi:hypothetical protein